MDQRLHRLHRRIRGPGGNRQRHLERVLRTAQARALDRTTHENRRRFRPALAPSCLTYNYACARIDDCATLRRRSAIVAVQRTGKQHQDVEMCNPCPPTFLLPISPAGHTYDPTALDITFTQALRN